MALLSIEQLTLQYRLQGEYFTALQDISLTMPHSETYGIVGESGSGKSTLAAAALGLFPPNSRITHGEIQFNGMDFQRLSLPERRKIWGAQIGYVPQDPLTALNPAIRIGEQIAEISRRHAGKSRAEAMARAVEMLDRVKLADPEQIARRYPHQLSGGQRQRALIAMALSSSSLQFLVLDEPTTSLDVTTEAAILDLFMELQDNHRAATLLITHNLGVVARMANRVAVLYAGEIMEDAPKERLFAAPLHPYTQLLLRAVPRIGMGKVMLQAISGQISSLRDRLSGCAFAARCPLAIDRCHSEKPQLLSVSAVHSVSCHRWEDIAAGTLSIQKQKTHAAPQPAEANNGRLLKGCDFSVRYKNSMFGRAIRAVDGVSFELGRGKTLGLVGESGSGKSSLSRALIGLVNLQSGEATLGDVELKGHPRQRTRDTIRAVQMIFQHPDESLNPYRTIGQILERPLRFLAKLTSQEVKQRAAALLDAVNLPADYLHRFPSELSGGEKQRVAIARAFAANPRLIICDEPVSSLDVSVQAAIINLLAQLQAEQNVSYLFISHDLAVVANLADDIAVIYLGEIVESGAADSFFTPPHHPYTEALLSAIPKPDPNAVEQRIRLVGDMPSAAKIPAGCRFHTRCPRYLGDLCRTHRPPLQTDSSGKQYRCHIPPGELAEAQNMPGLPQREIR